MNFLHHYSHDMIHSVINLEEEMLLTPSLKHCSNKYELAREGINKEFRIVSKEMSFQLTS